MSVKLFIPAVGAVGTIASIAGVSTSNQRSNDSADTTPTHKWKIEVEEISASLVCVGREGGHGSAFQGQNIEFNWRMKLDGGLQEMLGGERTITESPSVQLIEKLGGGKLNSLFNDEKDVFVMLIRGEDLNVLTLAVTEKTEPHGKL